MKKLIVILLATLMLVTGTVACAEAVSVSAAQA